MLPIIMAALSIAKQKADAQNAQNQQLANNLSMNQGQQPQQVQQPQNSGMNMNRLQQVFSLMGK
jgi:hypothetical protein